MEQSLKATAPIHSSGHSERVLEVGRAIREWKDHIVLALRELLLLTCTLAFCHFPIQWGLKPTKPKIVLALIIGLRTCAQWKSVLITWTISITLLSGWFVFPTPPLWITSLTCLPTYVGSSEPNWAAETPVERHVTQSRLHQTAVSALSPAASPPAIHTRAELMAWPKGSSRWPCSLAELLGITWA